MPRTLTRTPRRSSRPAAGGGAAAAVLPPPAPVGNGEDLAATGLFPRDPVDSGEATAWIRDRIAAGRLGAVEIAALVSHVRDHYYREDAAGWIDWGRHEFGYERSFLYLCYRVGRKLRSPHVRPVIDLMAHQDIGKLDVLTRVPDEQLPALLRHWDPSSCSRDEVKRKILNLGWGPEAIACSKCGEEYTPAEDDTGDVCPACRKAKTHRTKSQPDPVATFEKRVLDLRGLMNSDRKAARAAADGLGIARTGAELILLVLERQEELHDWAEEDYALVLVVIDSLKTELLRQSDARGIPRAHLDDMTARIAAPKRAANTPELSLRPGSDK